MFKKLKIKKILSSVLSLSLIFSCVEIANAKTSENKFLESIKSVVSSRNFIVPAAVIGAISTAVATPCIHNNVKYGKPRDPVVNHIIGENEKRVSTEYGGYLYATYSPTADEPWEIYNHYPQNNTTIKRKFTQNVENNKPLESKLNEIFGKMNESKCKTAFDKAVFLHDYICEHCKYEWGTLVDCYTGFKTHLGSDGAYDAHNCLIDGKAACEGIAKAYMLLLAGAGVECRVIFGTAFGAKHVWNIVKIEDKWYHVDVTWDLSFHATHGKYRWFMLSEKEITRNHII